MAAKLSNRRTEKETIKKRINLYFRPSSNGQALVTVASFHIGDKSD